VVGVRQDSYPVVEGDTRVEESVAVGWSVVKGKRLERLRVEALLLKAPLFLVKPTLTKDTGEYTLPL
jgi:hypothetical protein